MKLEENLEVRMEEKFSVFVINSFQASVTNRMGR